MSMTATSEPGEHLTSAHRRADALDRLMAIVRETAGINLI
jgi:hypothetical protein